MYEAFLEPSRYPNHGQRVTVGRRFIQSSTDIFVGWTRVQPFDFYVRQFRDMKVIPSSEQVTPWLRQFARKCGLVLARAHATTGDAAAIDAYLGKGQAFHAAMVTFASAYADQNERDHAQLVEAIRDGEIESAPGCDPSPAAWSRRPRGRPQAAAGPRTMPQNAALPSWEAANPRSGG